MAPRKTGNGSATTEPQMVTLLQEDGSVQVLASVPTALANEVKQVVEAENWKDGPLVIPPLESIDSYRSPKLSVPQSYYRRINWSEEYYEQEPLVHALIDREIDQSITNEEFHMPEEKKAESEALEEWKETVNRDIGQNGGLREFNRAMMLELTLTGLSVTLANWGTVSSGGVTVKVPKVLVNLDPKSILPRIDRFSGKREYFYRLSNEQYEAIKNDKDAGGITEIIKNPKSLIVESIDKIIDANDGRYSSVRISGPWLKIPIEDGYVISLRSRQADLWPRPTLVPIFSAIAMKRKLALADWAVADGMVNMIMVWTFPPGTKPSQAKTIVNKFMTGGRVQSHAVPTGVDVKLVTPDSSILNSAQKFWQPVSEIYEHFGFNLSAGNRSGGELDSPGLESSSNKSRWQFWRDTTQDHNNYWLREIQKRNGWDFQVNAIFTSRDLDNDANFRTFASSLYDRGLLSIETMLDLAQTSAEREEARRKEEQGNGMEKLFQVRPSFAQQTLPGQGRPPSGDSRSSESQPNTKVD